MGLELYKYPQKQNLKTSIDINEITPIYWNTLYPGEKIKNFSYKNLTRMVTPIYPTLDNPKFDIYAFAVPYRLIQNPDNIKNKNFAPILMDMTIEGGAQSLIKSFWASKFSSSGKALEESDLSNFGNLSDATFRNESTLISKFGLAPSVESLTSFDSEYALNLSYLLAYKKIYSDFFRQKQFEKETFYSLFNSIYNSPSLEFGEYLNSNRSSITLALKFLNTINYCNVNNKILNSITTNFIDTSFSKSFNDFRTTIFSNYLANDKILEKIDFGTQKDILLKVWNSNNYDRTSAQLIGFSEFNQTISQVINTTKSENQSLGDIGGMSVTYNKDILINEYEALEKTVILVLAVPSYKVGIINYADPYELMRPVFDGRDLPLVEDYNPAMLISQEHLYSGSFFACTDADSYYTILGTIKPWNYLRDKPDVIAGDIIDKWSNWTYNREYENLSGSGFSMSDFKATKKPFKDTLVSPNQDSFITEWEFSCDFYRTILPEFIVKETNVKGENLK